MIPLSSINFFIADPYNEEHIKLLTNFDEENKIEKKSSKILQQITKMYPKDEYEQREKQENDLYKIFCMKTSEKIKDYCYIQGEKDRKICTITLAPIKTKKRKILERAIDYIFYILNMEEIFISIPKEDNNLKQNVEEMDFESLGEENGIITYITEKENQKEMGIIINEISKRH